ncbi:aspartate/glutamate racemase family protein [Actinoplanes sp. NPDC024001]|uniref:aspartate/glutamate racemase family protein n=1 Tax=Actinoplanes sp. NPDC024001 TaxID=3154598 RepID=UPI0033C42FDB
MATIGFLHTADVHIATFGRIVAEVAPEIEARHLVDAGLLADAQAGGLTPEIAGRVRERLDELAADGADLIVCTCSTIGAVAETAAVAVPVLRADRPMADAAVAAGPRIGVLVTTESTLEPTLDLFRESAARAGIEVQLVVGRCFSAWQHFESGDLDRYHAEIAEQARKLASDVDVLVLAQASMTPAAALLDDLPVLTSPRSAVTAAVTAMRGGPEGTARRSGHHSLGQPAATRTTSTHGSRRARITDDHRQ